jgi:hypothetical protein
LGACAVLGVLLTILWFQYNNRKGELGTPDNYTFKDHLKWLFEGIGHDVWAFLRVIFIIAAVIAGFVLLYLVWSAISSGINQMSVKDVLVVIAVLLVLLLFKNTR